MDPLYEQRLRDEVIFLHSLWHQGPPRPAAVASFSTSTSATRYHLQPSKPIHFKKKKRLNGRGKSGKILPNNSALDSSSLHGAEWPCPATPPSTTAWPTDWGPTPEPAPLSSEEQSILAAKRAHQHALKLVREFFISYNGDGDGDGSDEIESSDDDDGDELMDEDEDCGRDEYSFILKVLEDTKLKEHYEKNFVMGEFSCLVCGAVGVKNAAKKFKGCLPLVQHSIAIEKTKWRSAHRAFAQAVCKVLRWDIHRLHEIVAMLSDKSGNTQGNGNGDNNEESSMALVHNVDSVEDDTSDGKDDEAEPDPEPASDAGKNVEEPATDELTTSISACHDNDITESQVHPRDAAATVSTSSVPMVCQHLQPSEAEWPCPSSPHLPSTRSWPTTASGGATQEKLSLKAFLPSTEEQSILAARDAHQHALKVVREFFRTNESDDSDEIDSDSDDDHDELMEEDSGSEKYSLFSKVFEEGKELREYYMKNFAEGEFSCLVCGAVAGKKTGKKFKGCLPLVQHSITIAKTKKREAHRTFGRAVCKVLGWDMDHLADIASMLSDKTVEIQGSSNSDSKEATVSSLDNVDLVKDDTLEGQNDQEATPEIGHVGSAISLNSHKGDIISVTRTDAKKTLENLGMVYQQSMEEEPASQGLAINSSVNLDDDKINNLGMEHQHNVEQPASEGSEINFTCPDADSNVGSGNLHEHNLEDQIAG